MYKILCFGDSNTFGFIPQTAGRYPQNSRWAGILKSLSYPDFVIIEAGCNNRTAFVDNPDGINQTGYKILPSLLSSDFDCIILAIGINDIQKFYKPTLDDINIGIQNLINIIKKIALNAKIILVSPSHLTTDILRGGFAFQFDEYSIVQSKQLANIYKNLAISNNCYFIDLNEIAKVSSVDGLHYEISEHQKIAKHMFNFLKDIFEV